MNKYYVKLIYKGINKYPYKNFNRVLVNLVAYSTAFSFSLSATANKAIAEYYLLSGAQ